MTTVATLYADLRRACKRGNALDADFPSAFQRALSFIEANYNLSWMRQKRTKAVFIGDSSTTLADGAYKVKSIEKLGYMAADGSWVYLRQVDPGDFSSTVGPPAGFIMTRAASGWALEFDAAWTENVTLSIWCYELTVWDGTETAEPWALAHAYDAVFARTMLNLSPVMRDAGLLETYRVLWLEASTALINEDGERMQGARTT